MDKTNQSLVQRACHKTQEVIINEVKYVFGNIYGFIKFLIMTPIHIIHWILCHIVRNRYKYITLALFIAYLCYTYGVDKVIKGAAYTFMAIILIVCLANIHAIIVAGIWILIIYGLYKSIEVLL